MIKESVNKFDLEAAFKALNEVEIPVVKGIRPNRENLQEKFTKKLVTDILVEDYFDVNDSGDLEQAQEEREAEIAKAKLARIEKIVDLDAETEEDLLPSYVGKFIIQCPQCMTLFYKKEEDIEKSEENPDIVNLNEPCQHCGNNSGYTLVGKVDQVGEDEAEQYDAEDFEEDELNLDFDETEESAEDTEEPAEEASTEEEEDLAPIEEPAEEEEEVKESLTEDVDLNKQLDLYNDFIKYLQKMVEQDEDALEEAKKLGNKEVIAAIEKRLENSKAELKAALPTTVKDEVAADELPTPEEADMEDAAENKEEEVKAEETAEKKESLTEGLRTWACWFDGQEVGTVEAETEDEAYEKMEATWPELHYGKYDGVAEILPVEDLNEDAPVSTLKRKLSATELIVKDLKAHPLFSSLSTRTIQRVLLPYYIENMGRENLSAQDMIDFFEFEGFAPYVLDNFMTMDPLARKELLKADAKFMEIFNAYALEYKLFPGNKDDLVAGETAFDYAFSIVFDFGDNGEAQDTPIARDTIKSFIKMYAAGKFDKALVETLKVKEAVEDSLDTLFNSEEFKKPISEKEVDGIIAKYEGLEEEIAPGIESEIAMKHIVDTWESIEDLDDESFNKLTENYLTEVYSNVKSFKATNCDLKDNKLVVEGTITFNSGKSKTTTFVYEAAKVADGKVILEGLNSDFASEKAFKLNCKLNTANCLIVESLNYNYTINETLVKGSLIK